MTALGGDVGEDVRGDVWPSLGQKRRRRRRRPAGPRCLPFSIVAEDALPRLGVDDRADRAAGILRGADLQAARRFDEPVRKLS